MLEKCAGCHEPEGIAPFSLWTYESAAPFAEAMLAAVVSGSMPPFLAQETEECTPRLPWRNDLRLTAEEIALLEAWVQAGAPEGDATAASNAELPAPTSLEREDVKLVLPEEIVVEGDADIHRCVVVDPGLERDAYVQGRFITSGNEKVLHHVVSYALLPGQNADGTPRDKAQLEAAVRERVGVGIGGSYDCFGDISLGDIDFEVLDAWAPGGLPNMAPANSGQPLDKDSLVVLDLHYHPIGSTERDNATALSLMLTDEPPLWVSRVILLGNFSEYRDYGVGVGELLTQAGESKAEFLIPAGADRHVEEMTFTVNLDATPYGSLSLWVYGAATHMHYVGTDMQVHLEHDATSSASAESECLIQTPAWDFNWQRGYEYDAPQADLPTIGHGDRLRFRCVYNNTTANPFLRAALSERNLESPVDVELGEDTLDEMCVAALGVMYINPDAF